MQSSQRNKEDVVKGSYGDYFDILHLDGEGETKKYPDPAENKAFIEKYNTDIVVSADMALKRFISGYKMSLATQLWTIAKFDETDTVIATADIDYKGVKGTYIYVGTLNIDDKGDVTSAKPHYLEVNGVVLGDDGYCDDVFDKIRNAFD